MFFCDVESRHTSRARIINVNSTCDCLTSQSAQETILRVSFFMHESFFSVHKIAIQNKPRDSSVSAVRDSSSSEPSPGFVIKVGLGARAGTAQLDPRYHTARELEHQHACARAR